MYGKSIGGGQIFNSMIAVFHSGIYIKDLLVYLINLIYKIFCENENSEFVV